MKKNALWTAGLAVVVGLFAGRVPLGAADTGASNQGQGAAYGSDANSMGQSQGSQASPTSDTKGLESKVLSDLHKDNQKEIRLGQLAQEKGQSDEVKKYGQHLMSDHQEADTKVSDLASSQSVQLTNPSEADIKKQTGYEKLHALNGAEFDKQFLSMIRKAHERTIAHLERSEKDLPSSSQVRQLVSQLLPTLKEHRDMAAQLEKQTASSSS